MYMIKVYTRYACSDRRCELTTERTKPKYAIPNKSRGGSTRIPKNECLTLVVVTVLSIYPTELDLNKTKSDLQCVI